MDSAEKNYRVRDSLNLDRKHVDFSYQECYVSLLFLMISIDSLLSLKAALYERHNVNSRCGWRAEK